MRTSRRQLVLMVLGWLGVVLVAAALTFAAVDSAGRSVGQPLAAPTVTARASTSVPSVGTRPGPTSPATPATTTSTPPADLATTAPAAGEGAPGAGSAPVTTAPAETPVPAWTPPPSSPTRTATTPVTPPDPPSPSSPPVTARSATFRTEGGAVTVTCRDAELTVTSITPENGWRFSQENERGHLGVTFRDGDRELEIAIACVGGTPTQVTR